MSKDGGVSCSSPVGEAASPGAATLELSYPPPAAEAATPPILSPAITEISEAVMSASHQRVPSQIQHQEQDQMQEQAAYDQADIRAIKTLDIDVGRGCSARSSLCCSPEGDGVQFSDGSLESPADGELYSPEELVSAAGQQFSPDDIRTDYGCYATPMHQLAGTKIYGANWDSPWLQHQSESGGAVSQAEASSVMSTGGKGQHKPAAAGAETAASCLCADGSSHKQTGTTSKFAAAASTPQRHAAVMPASTVQHKQQQQQQQPQRRSLDQQQRVKDDSLPGAPPGIDLTTPLLPAGIGVQQQQQQQQQQQLITQQQELVLQQLQLLMPSPQPRPQRAAGRPAEEQHAAPLCCAAPPALGSAVGTYLALSQSVDLEHATSDSSQASSWEQPFSLAADAAASVGGAATSLLRQALRQEQHQQRTSGGAEGDLGQTSASSAPSGQQYYLQQQWRLLLQLQHLQQEQALQQQLEGQADEETTSAFANKRSGTEQQVLQQPMWSVHRVWRRFDKGYLQPIFGGREVARKTAVPMEFDHFGVDV